MSTPTDELLKRATETINKQAATIRDLRGEETVGSAIEKSLSGETLHPAAAGAELIARAIRGGNADPYRKALKAVNHETPDEAMRKQRDRRDKDGPPERGRDGLPIIKKD